MAMCLGFGLCGPRFNSTLGPSNVVPFWVCIVSGLGFQGVRLSQAL